MGSRPVPFVIAAGVFLLDRITKRAIKGHLLGSDTITVIRGFFNIVHTENPGIAFGMLANAPALWRDLVLIVFSVIVLSVIAFILLKNRGAGQSTLLRLGLALVMGGAVGNLYDRIVNGTVTDFIEVYVQMSGSAYYFPAFNVADSAITVGAGLLVLDMWFSRERKDQVAAVER